MESTFPLLQQLIGGDQARQVLQGGRKRLRQQLRNVMSQEQELQSMRGLYLLLGGCRPTQEGLDARSIGRYSTLQLLCHTTKGFQDAVNHTGECGPECNRFCLLWPRIQS